jgi:glycosyltransferase involved in cell wall biosynthesis
MPTYNHAQFIENSVKSVINQTYKNWELIIIDNYSKDNTEEIVNFFDNPKIKYIKFRNNGIIAASRNLGIKESVGEWVAFLDSDDVWYPSKLEKMRQAIIENPEMILVCHNGRQVNNGAPGKILRCGSFFNNNMYERLLFKGNMLFTSALVIKREILLSTGGFSEKKEFVTVEDYEYWIRLAKVGKFHFMNDVLGEIHKHGDNESLNAERHARAFISVVSHHLELLYDKVSAYKKRKRLSQAWCTGGRLLLASGAFRNARSFCIEGFNYFLWNPKGWAVFILSLLKIKI